MYILKWKNLKTGKTGNGDKTGNLLYLWEWARFKMIKAPSCKYWITAV